jgi:hypothetical protein
VLVTVTLCSFQGPSWLDLPKLTLKGPHAEAKNCFPANVSGGGIAGEEETQVSGFQFQVVLRTLFHKHLSVLSPSLFPCSSYVGYLNWRASPVRAAASRLPILQMSERDQVLVFVEEMKTHI